MLMGAHYRRIDKEVARYGAILRLEVLPKSAQIPRPSQRRKRLYTASQRPKSFGRSRQGSPVRARYSTASTNRRSLSTGGRPARDFKVARMGAISAHVLSVSSKRTDIKFSFLRN